MDGELLIVAVTLEIFQELVDGHRPLGFAMKEEFRVDLLLPGGDVREEVPMMEHVKEQVPDRCGADPVEFEEVLRLRLAVFPTEFHLVDEAAGKLRIHLLDGLGSVAELPCSQLAFTNCSQAAGLPEAPESFSVELEQRSVVLEKRLEHLHLSLIHI